MIRQVGDEIQMSFKNIIYLKSDSPILTEESLLSQTVCVFCWTPLSSPKSSSIKIPPLIANCGHLMHLNCLQHEEDKIHDFQIRCPKCGQIIRTTKILQFLNHKDEVDKSTETRGGVIYKDQGS